MEKSELTYLSLLAHEGGCFPDGNCNVHAAMLREELTAYQKLRSHLGRQRRLDEVRNRQRQVERILGYDFCDELRKRSVRQSSAG